MQCIGLTRQGCEDFTMAETKAVHPNCWNKTKCIGLTRQGCEDFTMAGTKAVHPNCWNKTKCWKES